MVNLYDPRAIQATQNNLTPSMVQLAQTMQTYQYTVGFVHRCTSRFIDIHCYPSEDASYEEYWSAAEQSMTETDIQTSDDSS